MKTRASFLKCLGAISFLSVASLFASWNSDAAVYTTYSSGIAMRPTSIKGFADSFDDILFTLQVNGNRTITNLTLGVAPNGAAPGSYVPLSGATYIPGNDIAPISTLLNTVSNSTAYASVTYTFDPPLTNGQRTAVLLVHYPLALFAPFLQAYEDALLINESENHGSSNWLRIVESRQSAASIWSMSVSDKKAIVAWTGYSLEGSTNLSDWWLAGSNTVMGLVTNVFPTTSYPSLFFRAVR